MNIKPTITVFRKGKNGTFYLFMAPMKLMDEITCFAYSLGKKQYIANNLMQNGECIIRRKLIFVHRKFIKENIIAKFCNKLDS